MKSIRSFMGVVLSLLSLTTLTGCAVGSATAGYSIKAYSADSLTVEAEQRVVERVKREVLMELSEDYRQQQCEESMNCCE